MGTLDSLGRLKIVPMDIYVNTTGDTMTGPLDMATDDGIDYSPGSDIDVDLITVNVTGTPKLWWDEATDSFEMNKALTLPGGSLCLSGGGAGFEDAIRLSIDDVDEVLRIDKMTDGAWQPSELRLGAGTLYLGENIGISTAGHNLMTEDVAGDHRHLYAHTNFQDAGTESLQVTHLETRLVRVVIQSDDTGEFIGTTFGEVVQPQSNSMMPRVYLKIGSVAATSPVRVRVFEGTDDTGELIWDFNYSASTWGPADTEVSIDLPGYMEFEVGQSYYAEYTSDANISLRTNAAVDKQWLAFDLFPTYNNEALITREWTDGATYTEGDWFIDHDTRMIYVCNTTGVQTGTFASNSDKWNSLRDYADFKSVLAQNVQYTGLTGGIVLTKASDTTIDISAGTGYVADYSDPANPVTTPVNFAGVTGYAPLNLATDGLYVIGINESGSVVEFSIQSVSTQDGRDNILVGVYIVVGGVVNRTVPAPFNLGYGTSMTAIDFIRDVIGPANVIGNLIFANAGANLSIDTTGGIVFIIASNFRNNPEIPDELSIASGSAISFYRQYREASPSTQLAQDGPLTTFVNPDKWDDGSGTLADVSTNDFTVQVVYATPGPHYVVYGQEVFNTMSDAETALLDGTLTFDEYPTLQALVQRAFVIVREGTTDLSDPADCTFFDAGKFRIGGVSTSGGIPGINIPGGSDSNIQYNDGGVFGGSNNLVWDDVNNRMGVGIGVPTAPIHIGDGGLRLDRSGADSYISFMRDGAYVGQMRTSTTGLKFASSSGSIEYAVVKTDGADAGNVGIGVDTPLTLLHMRSSQVVIDTVSYPWTMSKYNSQGVVWSAGQPARTPSLVFNAIAQDRPEISWYRGSRDNPEFSIRQHPTNDKGAEIYSGDGTSSPILTMAFNLGDVGIGTNSPGQDLDVYRGTAEGVVGIRAYNSDAAGIGRIIASSFGGGQVALISNSSSAEYMGMPVGFSGLSSNYGDLVFAVGSGGLASEIMRVAADGNVGIGLVDPIEPLTIDIGANTWGGLQVTNSNTGSGSQAGLILRTDHDVSAKVDVPGNFGWQLTARGPAWTEADQREDLMLEYHDDTSWRSVVLFEHDTGNMGLGTATPDETLHVFNGSMRLETDSADVSLLFTDNEDDNTMGFLFDKSTENLILVGGMNGDRDPSFLDALMTFTRGFYVGVKCTPTTEFEVNGNTKLDGNLEVTGIVTDPLQFPSDTGPRLNLYSTTYAIGVELNELRIASNGVITFRTDGYEGVADVIITDDGRVGIGTTDPQEELHIKCDHPNIAFEEEDAASNEKVWEIGALNEEFSIRTANDGHTGTQTILKAMNRASTSVGLVVIPNAFFSVGTETVSGKLTVDQSSTGAGIPVLTLDQADTDQPWIEFLGGQVVSGKSGQNEYLEVKVGGNTRYLRLFN